MIDALWESEAPATARNSLHVRIAALRKTLGSDRIETRAPGYVVHVEAGELDLERFEHLILRGRGEDLRQALALWSGAPLADFARERWATAAIARLDEMRLLALERLADIDLELVRLIPRPRRYRSDGSVDRPSAHTSRRRAHERDAWRAAASLRPGRRAGTPRRCSRPTCTLPACTGTSSAAYATRVRRAQPSRHDARTCSRPSPNTTTDARTSSTSSRRRRRRRSLSGSCAPGNARRCPA